MVDLAYGTSAFDRTRGDFPLLPVINMIAEVAPTENKTSLQSRPGLEETGIEMGMGPIRAMYQIDGVLDNALFAVSGTDLYSSGTEIGTVDGTGFASIAGYEDFLFVNAGERIWGYDGTTLSAISFPDSANVSHICVGASRLVAIREDTGKFYWSDALTSTIDALSFATAENSPDKLKYCLFIGDTLILFGSETVEFWPVTTDNDAPFQPLVGRVFQVGIRATGCATEFNSTFAWITNRNQICVSEPNGVVSTPSLEAKLAVSQNAYLWTFELEGLEFLAVRMDEETWVYNPRSQQWSMFESYGGDNWIAGFAANEYLGSVDDGRILQWSDGHADFDGILERRFRAWAAVNSSSFELANVTVRTNPGQTSYIAGDYANPTVEIRTSRDGGYEWSPWKTTGLGAQGKYRTLTQWRALGHFSYPGILIEFRVTDPVPFRVSDVVVNEPYGGI